MKDGPFSSINVFTWDPEASMFSEPSLMSHFELRLIELIQWNQFIWLLS